MERKPVSQALCPSRLSGSPVRCLCLTAVWLPSAVEAVSVRWIPRSIDSHHGFGRLIAPRLTGPYLWREVGIGAHRPAFQGRSASTHRSARSLASALDRGLANLRWLIGLCDSLESGYQIWQVKVANKFEFQINNSFLE